MRPFVLDDVTLAVLAGGAGARMGRPKGSLSIAGRPVLAWLRDHLAWPGPTLVVTAPGRERPPAAARFDREVTDPVAGEGPLRGVLTALEHAATPVVVVATVDMPAVTAAMLGYVVRQLGHEPDRVAAMLRRPTDDGPQTEPFPSAYRAGPATVAVRDQLRAGRRAVHGLLARPGVSAVDAPADWPPVVWTNLNYPADVTTYLASIREPPPGRSS